MTEIELKPCPFCGVKLTEYLRGVWKHPFNECFLIIARSTEYVTKGEVDTWNRRANDE